MQGLLRMPCNSLRGEGRMNNRVKIISFLIIIIVISASILFLSNNTDELVYEPQLDKLSFSISIDETDWPTYLNLTLQYQNVGDNEFKMQEPYNRKTIETYISAENGTVYNYWMSTIDLGVPGWMNLTPNETFEYKHSLQVSHSNGTPINRWRNHSTLSYLNNEPGKYEVYVVYTSVNLKDYNSTYEKTLGGTWESNRIEVIFT